MWKRIGHTFFLFFISFTQFSVTAQQLLPEVEVTQLINLSVDNLHKKKYQEALDGFLSVALQTRLQRTIAEHQAYVFSQTMSVKCHQHLKQYEQAYLLADRVLNEDSLTDSEKSDMIGLFVTNGYLTALKYMGATSRSYDKARAIFQKVKSYANEDMKKRILKQEPISWYKEGCYYLGIQQYQHALSCMKLALSGFLSAGLPLNVMETYCRLAEIHYHSCNWIDSLRAYHKAEGFAEDEGDKMNILIQQWKLCEIIENNELLWHISDRMDSLAAESKNVDLQFEYNLFRANQAENQGRLKTAEQWYLHNMSLLSSQKDASKFKYYVKLRHLYKSIGDWDRALQYATLARDLIQECYSPFEAGFYSEYGFIADIFKHKGDRDSCFKNLDTLFRAVSYTDEPHELSKFYCSRASAYSSFGEYEKALDDYLTADELLAVKYGSEDEDRVLLSALIGGMEHSLKHYDESELRYAQYAQGIKSIFGEDNAKYIEALKYLANAEAFAGHIEKATADYTDAAVKFKHHVRGRWQSLSSADKDGYWLSSVQLLQNMTPFALKAGECQSEFTEACYDGLIMTKAFLLESEQSIFNLLMKKGSDEDLRTYTSIQYLQARIKDLERMGREYTDSILTISTQVRQLESALAKHCKAYGDVTTFMDVDCQRVRQELGENEVLLDFTDFVSKDRGRVYAVYVVTKKCKYPMLMELFQESSIDSLGVRFPYQYYSGSIGKKFCELLWKPLKKYVPQNATVYYVPSQMLFQIVPESLPAADGKLLGEYYNFVRLSSARELVRYDRRLPIARKNCRLDAVLYGGLLYSIDGNIMAELAEKFNVSSDIVMRDNPEFVRGDSLFRELPGSKAEIESIGEILRGAGLSVVPYTGKEGTEESFLTLNNQAPTMLHIATHGFYYTSDAAEDVDYLRGYTDAMSLSGLVLAGGNAAWLGHEMPDNVLGGILTADDIARINLKGVELVILSACHSGMGEITQEGLYGLQRAFKKAGVKTIVMSLWEESDIAGPEFMTAFYHNLVTKSKWNKHRAFNAAKNTLRDKYPDSPSLWAGFVMLD